MKNFLLVFSIVAFLSSSCSGGSNRGISDSGTALQDTGKAVLIFREYEHSFGKVKEGEKVACVFNFDNTGTGNLIIQSAITTCGCTVSKYDRKPIAPGKQGKLEVTFDTSGRNGMQTKTISVKSNASVPVIILKITADVQSD
jgi:uncharacterized cupredoxin-like copper-binding protein